MGINLDSKLNFLNHVKIIENKLSRAVEILWRLETVLPQTALLKLYYAFLHPHILYGLIVWGSTFPSYFTKVIALQNKAVKFNGGGNYYDSPTPF